MYLMPQWCNFHMYNKKYIFGSYGIQAVDLHFDATSVQIHPQQNHYTKDHAELVAQSTSLPLLQAPNDGKL